MSERSRHDSEADRLVELNRANWDARVPVHLEAHSYNEALAKLRAGGHDLRQEVVDAVTAGCGDVAGRSLVHLMCHIGLDTLSWARLGAEVTGVDFSEPAIETARGFADELGLAAEFVQSDLYDAADALERTYDVVFTSEGVLCWLPDLQGWARVIARLLKPGGTFYLMDGHPFTEIFDDADHPDGIGVRYGYFDRGPLRFGPGPSYAGPEVTLPESVEWLHPVGEILNALIDAGLTIQRVEEYPDAFFEKFSGMEPVADGGHELAGRLRGKLPMRMMVRATKR
ncbi:MAG: methyltransferase domain-containing protein [Planctomycetota bacterium]